MGADKPAGIDVKELAFDINSANESPFITDPAEVAALDIPAEYVRRLEDAQRLYGMHHSMYRNFSQEWDNAAFTITVQCGWLGVGLWVLSRGMRYSDPLGSVIGRWTRNKTLQRMTTPISCLGLFIFFVTLSQLPYDVRVFLAADHGVKENQAKMNDAMAQRDAAFREGRDASLRLKQNEESVFEANMKKKAIM